MQSIKIVTSFFKNNFNYYIFGIDNERTYIESKLATINFYLQKECNDEKVMIKFKSIPKRIQHKIIPNIKPIFKNVNELYTPPIDIDIAYHDQLAAFWTVNDISISPEDMQMFKSLPQDIQNVCNAILLFFTIADKLVISNICTLSQIPYQRAQNFYRLQGNIEDIHDQIYVLAAKAYYFITESKKNADRYINDTKMLEAIVDLSKELDEYELSIDNFECQWIDEKTEIEKKIFQAVLKKASFMNRWKNVDSYIHNLIAFFSIESLCFSPLFTVIRMFKNNSNGLSFIVDINNKVEIDERIHADYGMMIYKVFVENKISNEEFVGLIKEVTEMEIEFLNAILPNSILGKPIESFITYTKYAADAIIEYVLGKEEAKQYLIYNIPKTDIDKEFSFAPMVPSKHNFFERVGAYIHSADVIVGFDDVIKVNS